MLTSQSNATESALTFILSYVDISMIFSEFFAKKIKQCYGLHLCPEIIFITQESFLGSRVVIRGAVSKGLGAGQFYFLFFILLFYFPV